MSTKKGCVSLPHGGRAHGRVAGDLRLMGCRFNPAGPEDAWKGPSLKKKGGRAVAGRKRRESRGAGGEGSATGWEVSWRKPGASKGLGRERGGKDDLGCLLEEEPSAG